MKRKLSREARRAMAESGRANLTAWLEKQATESDAISADVAAFREQIFAELGTTPSATKRALAQTAISTYETIQRVNAQLSRKRPKDVARLSERISWLSGTMLRCLKQLDLGVRPKPRTLADLANRTEPQKEQSKGANDTFSAPKPNEGGH